jgi:hypothetical protein
VLAAFGLEAHDGVGRTFDEADADPDRPQVRVGEVEGWAYAVEHFTARGADSDTLCRLSAPGGEALALVYQQDISAFQYAANGEYVSGFDLVVPHIRWGRDPHRFDATMAQAGFLQPGPRARAPAMGARFVQLTFGITIDRQMLERPLPSFDLS